jgi:hypothetical protein
MLLDYLPLFPSKVFTVAFPAFDCCCGIPCSALSANFHIKPALLSQGFFEGVHYRHLLHLVLFVAKQTEFASKYTFCLMPFYADALTFYQFF